MPADPESDSNPDPGNTASPAAGVPDERARTQAQSGQEGNSASTLIEAPQKPGRNKLDPHAFPDGGGSGGAEAFRRSRVK